MEKISEDKNDKKREEEKTSWFKRWLDHLAKMDQWDEQSHACMRFPYSCY